MLNYFVSNSGYPVFHYNAKHASTCKAEIVVNCGASHEDQDSWGVSHFLEHMCFQGTPSKDKHQISREQSKIGHYNAYTSQFNTVYHFDSLTEDFETGFQLLKEVVFDSCYPENEFEKEKNVILEEWRQYDNYPSTHFNNFLLQKCFGNEGHPVIGTEQSIEEMSLEKLRRYHDKWYGKNNIFIVVVGNLEFNQVVSTVNKILPKSKEVEKTYTCWKNFQTQDHRSEFSINRFEQAVFGMVNHAQSPMEVIAELNIDSFFQRALSKSMYEYIRDDLGLCYSVGCGDFGHFENSYNVISMYTNNDYLEKAEKELNYLFQKIKTDGFPHEIFEIARKEVVYSQIKRMDSVSGISSSIVDGVLKNSDEKWFADQGTKLLSTNWYKECADRLKPEDLQKHANRWLGNFKQFIMKHED